jgi:hypothetical protein
MQLYYCSLGVPSPPQNVKVTKVIKNSVNLEWSPPVSDGGSKIRRYQIWKRVEMTDDWVKVTIIEQYKTNYTILMVPPPLLKFYITYLMVSPPLLKFLYHIPDGFSIFTEVYISHT